MAGHRLLVDGARVIVLLFVCHLVASDAFRVTGADPLAPSMKAVGASQQPAPRVSRRGLAHFAIGAAVTLRAPGMAAAEFPRIASVAKGGFDDWVEFDDDLGLQLKEVSEGLGAETKDGDRLRLRYTIYLLDGTVVSRGSGVEQEFTLGRKQVPPGLENGVRGMKAGAERMLYIPPEIGWDAKYRAAALSQVKTCGSTCPLDNKPVIVFAKLEGYKKAECKGGDMPIQVNAQDLAQGSLSVTIGNAECPEGDLEVTEKRLRTLDMLNKMKQSGKLKAEEKQPFIIP